MTTKTIYGVVDTLSGANNRCSIILRTSDLAKAKAKAATNGRYRVITCSAGQRWEYGDVVANAHGFGVAA